MALRMMTLGIAVSMLVLTGCHSRSNYQPACPPAVLAATPAPCPAPCPGPIAPPPGAILR